MPLPPPIATAGDVAGPGEPAADRAAHLEHVAELGDVVQVAGHLAVGQPLDHQLDQRVGGVGGDRVGALGGVVVGRAQADDVVLAGQVLDAVGDVEAQPRQAAVGAVDLGDGGRGPAASSDGHGSPW